MCGNHGGLAVARDADRHTSNCEASSGVSFSSTRIFSSPLKLKRRSIRPMVRRLSKTTQAESFAITVPDASNLVWFWVEKSFKMYSYHCRTQSPWFTNIILLNFQAALLTNLEVFEESNEGYFLDQLESSTAVEIIIAEVFVKGVRFSCNEGQLIRVPMKKSGTSQKHLNAWCMDCITSAQ